MSRTWTQIDCFNFYIERIHKIFFYMFSQEPDMQERERLHPCSLDRLMQEKTLLVQSSTGGRSVITRKPFLGVNKSKCLHQPEEKVFAPPFSVKAPGFGAET
jgi:hypothetical protein